MSFTEPPAKVPKPDQTIVSKYNYKANPNSPMGEELSLKQGERLKFVSAPSSNPHWWIGRNESGKEGIIPASYMHVRN